MKIWQAPTARLILVTLLLQVVVVVAALWWSVGAIQNQGRARLAQNGEAMLKVLGRVATTAAQSDGLAGLELQIEEALADPHILRVVLVDGHDRIVASTERGDLGNAASALIASIGARETPASFWRQVEVPRRTGAPGFLAIEFSNFSVEAGNSQIMYRGIAAAVIGMLALALGAFVVNRVSTRRRVLASAGSVALDFPGARKAGSEGRASQQGLETARRLAGGVVHDFNNVLEIAIGNLELVQASLPDDPAASTLLAKIDRALDRGAELTRRLMLFSATRPRDPAAVSVNDVIEQLDGRFAELLEERIDLVTRLVDEPWLVKVDREELYEVLTEIVTNACEAMDFGGDLVIETKTVTLGADDPQVAALGLHGDFVVVSVTDSGRGIPEEILTRVFEPFFTTKDSGRGKGFGLSLAYGFATRAGGLVDVVSDGDSGTRVRLFLPRDEGRDP